MSEKGGLQLQKVGDVQHSLPGCQAVGTVDYNQAKLWGTQVVCVSSSTSLPPDFAQATGLLVQKAVVLFLKASQGSGGVGVCKTSPVLAGIFRVEM